MMPPFTRMCLNFNHLDNSEQTWRHHLAAFIRKVIVTPAVCPSLFEFLIILTFGAQRGNHIVSTAFQTIAKQPETGKARCPHAISNLS